MKFVAQRSKILESLLDILNVLPTRSTLPILLQGPGSTGKTELAKAFGRWWQHTGGGEHPSLVIWHSLELGIATFGVDGLINRIGLTVFDSRFAQLDPADRRNIVIDLLQQHRCR